MLVRRVGHEWRWIQWIEILALTVGLIAAWATVIGAIENRG